MTRLKDIALRAGVSIMTVSKVLRDAPDISGPTKQRIRALAEQMGYVPDSMAQGLRTKKTQLFGLVISATTNPIFARMMMGIEERVYDAGYNLVYGHSLNRPEREEALIRRFMARRVDGLFVSPVYRMEDRAPVYEELKRRKLPVVLLDHHAPFCADFVCVETDDAQASYEATTHLIELGHRRIAFLAGPSFAPWAQKRLDGYRRAIRDAQLNLNDELVFQAGATLEDGAKAAAQMIHEAPQFTAIQAANDLIAIGASNLFLDQGWRIPQDLSIVGFGNVMAAEYFRVPLTTVRQPVYRMAVAAVDCMLALVRGEEPTGKHVPAELIRRASTAPPAAKRLSHAVANQHP